MKVKIGPDGVDVELTSISWDIVDWVKKEVSADES